MEIPESNIEDLKKLNNLIEAQKNQLNNIQSNVVSVNKKVTFAPIPENDNESALCEKVVDACVSQEINSFSLFKTNVPKKTVYLFIVLLIVGIIIWYFSLEKSKKKKDEKQ